MIRAFWHRVVLRHRVYRRDAYSAFRPNDPRAGDEVAVYCWTCDRTWVVVL